MGQRGTRRRRRHRVAPPATIGGPRRTGEGKYPPAKQGASVCEPLKAAVGIANATLRYDGRLKVAAYPTGQADPDVRLPSPDPGCMKRYPFDGRDDPARSVLHGRPAVGNEWCFIVPVTHVVHSRRAAPLGFTGRQIPRTSACARPCSRRSTRAIENRLVKWRRIGSLKVGKGSRT